MVRRATPAKDSGVQGIPMIASAFLTNPNSETDRNITATVKTVDSKSDFISSLLPNLLRYENPKLNITKTVEGRGSSVKGQRIPPRHLTLNPRSYFGFAASPVNWRNSIFLAPLGGVKLNICSVNFGARSQFLTNTVNSGSPLTCFEVRTNLRGSGLPPSSIQICQSTSAPRNARWVDFTPATTLEPTTNPEVVSLSILSAVLLYRNSAPGAITSSFSRAKSSIASMVGGAAVVAYRFSLELKSVTFLPS